MTLKIESCYYTIKTMKKRNLITLLCILAVAAAGYLIIRFTPAVVPMTADGKMAMYTRNKPEAEITVAVISETETKISAYGHDGKKIDIPERNYEIGQITETFTGALTAEACQNGRITLDTCVSDLIGLPRGAYVPSVYELVTHSSAYSDYADRVLNVKRENPYSGINGNDIISSAGSFRLSFKPPYLYSESDYGAAVLGAMISKAYDVDFYSILTIFAQEKLGLEHTFVALEQCMEGGWKWDTDDAYIAALGLTSDVSDMVAYAKLYLDGRDPILNIAADPLYEINADSAVGYLWNISHSGLVLSSHGQTEHASAAIVIDRNNSTAVIVLSNYPDDKYGNTLDLAQTILKETEAV